MHTEHFGPRLNHEADRISQLNLAPLPGRGLRQKSENRGAENISGSHGQVARRLGRSGLLNKVSQFEDVFDSTAWFGNAVMDDLVCGNLFEGDDGLGSSANEFLAHRAHNLRAAL